MSAETKGTALSLQLRVHLLLCSMVCVNMLNKSTFDPVVIQNICYIEGEFRGASVTNIAQLAMFKPC